MALKDNLKDKLRENFTNVKNIEDLKYVDRKLLIVGGTIFFVLIGIYYYFLVQSFFHKQEIREANAAKAAQQEKAEKKASENSVNVSMTESHKADIPQQSNPNQSNTTQKDVVDIFKIPGNYMNLSAIQTDDYPMYLDTFDILYDYFNLAFQGNYQGAFNYLNRDFVKQNNITVDNLASYYKDRYFKQNTFNIYKVTNESPYYTADVTINDLEHPGAAFNVFHKLVNNNGKYSIVIDDLVSYMQSNSNQISNPTAQTQAQ